FESVGVFQGIIKAKYEVMVDDFGLYRIDATESLVLQQRKMRQVVEPLLSGVTKADDGDLASALSEFDLSGRYMPELFGR
ncbi:MAG: hypothetical protein OXG11_00730, partial [Chloroflexi bacterium]|nr:hypothetical protein [Chloroflexota bacterium]